MLDLHTKHAANPDEKLEILQRIAGILRGPLQDPAGAALRLEEVVRQDPDDGKALDTLVEIYSGLGKYHDLARIMDMQVERVVADSGRQAEFLRQLARLVEGPLRDLPRARKSWEQLLELMPTDAEALEALARICTAEEDWHALVRVLDRQIPLAEEPGRAVELGLFRAQVFDDKLHDTDSAAEALERLISEVDPRSIIAHDRLRKYYEDDEDWARAVKVMERQMFLTEDPVERVRRAMQLGALIRDRVGDDRKAVSIFERVLEMDPENMEALHGAATLYVKTGDYQRLAYADEKLLEREADNDERKRLMLEIAGLYENHLDDAPRGFEWYRRAYLETPDGESLQMVDQAAERHGLFEELIQIYEGARARATDPIEQLAASLKIALICDDKLRDPRRAFATLVDALPADPAGRELLANLERLAEKTNDWLGLLDVYARVARARTETSERIELLRLRAEVRERRMGDPSGALDEMLRSFAMAPTDKGTQEEILRLARVTGRWEEAIRVEGHLFALAGSLDEKLSVARNAAYLVEHEVKDLVRAFRAYLNAFRLAPDDDEIVGHLWRLAARIGRYDKLRRRRGRRRRGRRAPGATVTRPKPPPVNPRRSRSSSTTPRLTPALPGRRERPSSPPPTKSPTREARRLPPPTPTWSRRPAPTPTPPRRRRSRPPRPRPKPQPTRKPRSRPGRRRGRRRGRRHRGAGRRGAARGRVGRHHHRGRPPARAAACRARPDRRLAVRDALGGARRRVRRAARR